MGVNLSGCEFSLDGALCPTATSVRSYLDKGFRAIRIPFRGAQVGIPAVVARIKAAASAATSQGAYVILDRHDYGTTFDAAQAAWWVSFAKNFPDTKYVMIDTMNEPRTGASYQPDAKTKKSYASEVNAGIAAFRAAGMKHKLLIEWRGSSGMSRFDKGEAVTKACESPACSFDRAGGLKDPLGLTMVSGHRYFDVDGSGTSGVCDKRMPLLRMFVSNTDYNVQIRGLKVWVGEMAFGSAKRLDPWCKTVGGAIIERMKSMPDVYTGVTWWGGGAGWKESYIYKIEPKKGTFDFANPSPYLQALTQR
jgi:endoglucanase